MCQFYSRGAQICGMWGSFLNYDAQVFERKGSGVLETYGIICSFNIKFNRILSDIRI